MPRLKKHQIAEIKDLLINSDIPLKNLAKQYNIVLSSLSRINNGETYNDGSEYPLRGGITQDFINFIHYLKSKYDFPMRMLCIITQSSEYRINKAIKEKPSSGEIPETYSLIYKTYMKMIIPDKRVLSNPIINSEAANYVNWLGKYTAGSGLERFILRELMKIFRYEISTNDIVWYIYSKEDKEVDGNIISEKALIDDKFFDEYLNKCMADPARICPTIAAVLRLYNNKKCSGIVTGWTIPAHNKFNIENLLSVHDIDFPIVKKFNDYQLADKFGYQPKLEFKN